MTKVKRTEADYMLHIATGTGSIDLDPAGLLCLPVTNVRKIARLSYADTDSWTDNLDKICDFCRPLQGEKPAAAKSRARILQIWTDLDPAAETAATPADTSAVQLSRAAGTAVKRIAKSAATVLHGITGYHTDGTTVCITDGYHGVSYPGAAIPGISVDVDKDCPRDIIRSTARDCQYHPGLDGLHLKAVKALQKTGMDEHGNAATHIHIDGVGYYNLQQLVNVLSAIDAPCDCYVRPERRNTYTLIFTAGNICGVVTPCNWTANNVERNNWVAVDLPGSPAADAPVADAPVADAPVADAPAADAPVADAPVADAPAADAPAADAPAADAPVADAPWWAPAETMIAAWAKSNGYKCAAYAGSHPVVYNIHSSYIKDPDKTLADVAAEARALPDVRVDVRDSYIAIVPIPADAPIPAPILDADVIAAALQPAEESIMDRLQQIPGLDITIRKSTIWISGQTYPARVQLKSLGCKWSSKRKAWYYQAPRPAAVIPDGLTVVKQTSACTWVDGPADLLQAAGAKWSAKREAWYIA